jgi:dipeptidyl aminopeptidase/acylaminoacyl peptidase
MFPALVPISFAQYGVKMAPLFLPRFFLLGVLMLTIAGLGSGCSHLPLAAPLPAGLSVSRVGDQRFEAPFAVSPDSRQVALVSSGLHLLELTTETDRLVRSASPAALAWSPAGTKLAAAFSDDTGTVLFIFSPTGDVLAESRVKTPVTSLAWLNDREIAAGGLATTTFKFGVNVATVLYRWDGSTAPSATTLKETTLRPATARAGEKELARGNKIAFSPLRDEVLFLHPHDPPLFTPHYKVILKNLTSGAEREVAAINLGAGAPLFAADGERVTVGDGHSPWLDPWKEQQLGSLPAPGRELAVSPAGGYLLIDGTLYRDGAPLLKVAGKVVGHFAANGRSLFLAYDSSLYRLDGLQEPAQPELSPSQADRLRQLRSWRTEGLITPAEYQIAKEKVLHP